MEGFGQHCASEAGRARAWCVGMGQQRRRRGVCRPKQRHRLWVRGAAAGAIHAHHLLLVDHSEADVILGLRLSTAQGTTGAHTRVPAFTTP